MGLPGSRHRVLFQNTDNRCQARHLSACLYCLAREHQSLKQTPTASERRGDFGATFLRYSQDVVRQLLNKKRLSLGAADTSAAMAQCVHHRILGHCLPGEGYMTKWSLNHAITEADRSSMGLFEEKVGSEGKIADGRRATRREGCMKLLIAEDNGLFQRVLQQVLGKDHELVLTRDGNEAWAALQAPDAPRLAILDWVMPGLTGPQVCRKVRSCPALASMYLIILTTKNSEADIVAGLRSGADDYLTKPPIAAELQARVRVGERILALQEMVESQSLEADQAPVREIRLRDLLVQGLPEAGLPRQVPCGVETCTREKCEPADCCSISYTESDSLMHRLLGVRLEQCHPHR